MPFCPGYFHPYNTVIIADVDTHPRISGIIDREFSGLTFATSFAQVPPLHRRSPRLGQGSSAAQTEHIGLCRFRRAHLYSQSGRWLTAFRSLLQWLWHLSLQTDDALLHRVQRAFFSRTYSPEMRISTGYCYALMMHGILEKNGLTRRIKYGLRHPRSG